MLSSGLNPRLKPGALILETGEIFKGLLLNSGIQTGELVFNTSHSGYEEMATDPSYYNQILLMTAPLQGNYSSQASSWQSDKIRIQAFVCVEMQNSSRDSQWLQTLKKNQIPVLSFVDTRSVVLHLRKKGVLWGAVAPLSQTDKAMALIKKNKDEKSDWTQKVCVKDIQDFKGKKKKGLKLALIDFGYKKNILQELLKLSSVLRVFPSNSPSKSVKEYQPAAIILSNGPGDPKNVVQGTGLVKNLLSYRPIFGICMGHQILAQALGAKTYKLKFGHRGSNHPIKDELLNQIYISAQNHGYAVLPESLPPEVSVSHTNLNDHTVAGIVSKKHKCLSVQFHPENRPGPTEALQLFNYFFKHFVKKHAS